MRAALRPAAVALLAVAAAAPAAAFPPNDGTYRGRCVLVAANEGLNVVTTPNWYAGRLGGAIAAFAPTLGHNPVTVTSLVCQVRVNGVPVVSTPAGSGPGGAATQTNALFYATDTDSVQVCALVDTLDTHGQTVSYADCAPVRRLPLPPQPVVDSLYGVCMSATNNPPMCAIVTNTRVRVIFGAAP